MINSSISTPVITRPPVSVAETPTRSLIRVTQVRNANGCCNLVACSVTVGTVCGAIAAAAGFFLASSSSIPPALLSVFGGISCFATGTCASRAFIDRSLGPSWQEDVSSEDAIITQRPHPSFSDFPPSYDDVTTNEDNKPPAYDFDNSEYALPPSYFELSFSDDEDSSVDVFRVPSQISLLDELSASDSDDEGSLVGVSRVPSQISFLDTLGLNASDEEE